MKTPATYFLAILLIVNIVLCVSDETSAYGKSFEQLQPRIKYWANYPIHKIGQNASVEDVLTIVADRTRAATFVSAGLLFRNSANDSNLAAELLVKVLERQYTDPNDMDNYGSWKLYFKEDGEPDKNWREFVGNTLIIILEEFPDKLPTDLKNKMKQAVVRAGEGEMRRNVGIDYSNISINSAILMEYAGRIANRSDVRSAGIAKANDIYNLYQQHHSLSEFNSPTYYGFSLFGLRMWQKYSDSEEMKNQGAKMEQDVWADILDFYNPGMHNLCGPYFRAYDMDMLRCNALLGEWIAIALNDANMEPLPVAPGPKNFELDMMPSFVLLYEKLPDSVLARLKKINKPRFVNRDVPNKYPGDKIKKVTAYITKNWMMGGVTGHRKQWNQLMPGTIHWKDPESEFANWILVPSYFKTDIVVDEKCMSIYSGGIDSNKLVLLVSAPSVSKECFKKTKWDLPGMSFGIDTALSLLEIKELNLKELDGYAMIQTVFEENYVSGYKIFALSYAVDSNKLKSDRLLIRIKPN